LKDAKKTLFLIRKLKEDEFFKSRASVTLFRQ